MDKTTLSTAGGVVAAVVASLCCIGPALVTLLGIGSIGAFAAFEATRPYLIAVTVVILALAFYLTYRKREVQCEDGTCKVQSAGRWNKIGVWIATILAAGALTFPYFGGSLVATAHQPPPEAVASGTSAVVAVLNVRGMDCKACAAGLQATLSKVQGVRAARIEFDQGKALVEYDPANVQPERLVAEIEAAGFNALLVETKTTLPARSKKE